MSAIQSPDETQKLAEVSGMRRRVAVGTAVESRKRSVCDDSKGRRWERGRVIGHDPSLDLPIVKWERGLPEAVHDDEFEIEAR